MMIHRRLMKDPQRVYVFVHSARHPVAFLLTVGTFFIGVSTFVDPSARPESIRSQLDPFTQRVWAAQLVLGAALLMFSAVAENRLPRWAYLSTMCGAGLYGFGCLTLSIALYTQFGRWTVSGSWGAALFVAYGWWAFKLIRLAWRERRREEADHARNAEKPVEGPSGRGNG